MGVENVQRIIDGLKNTKFEMDEGLIETATPTELATDEMICYSEEKLGVKLPETYKTFLKEYANGNISLFAVEPLVSVGLKKKRECLCDIETSAEYLNFKSGYDNSCYIYPEDRSVRLSQLIMFTYGDYFEFSNDHWAFICDKEYSDNNYPLGYVTQDRENIVCVIESFEKWLDIFWEGNKGKTKDFESVFNLLYPDYEDRCELRDDCVTPEDLQIYKKMQAKYDENFKKYGVK